MIKLKNISLFIRFWFFFILNFWCFNATFSNISAISWRPALVVDEAGEPGENHRPWASNHRHLGPGFFFFFNFINKMCNYNVYEPV